MIQQRAGRKFYSIPGMGIIFGPAAAAAAAPWYLSGGISAANCIAAYQAKAVADQAASYVNLANPGTYNLTTTAAPTWDTVTGWTFDGATQFLKTGITPTSTYSMIARFANWNQTLALGYFIGSYWTDRFYLGVNTLASNAIIYGFGNKNKSAETPRLTAGVMAVSNFKGYRDGVLDWDEAGTWAGSATAIQIGRRGINTGSGDNYAATDVIAAAIYDIPIDSYQAALYAAMAAL